MAEKKQKSVSRKKLSQQSESPYKFVLPAKITGVVFWGLVLIGLIIAVILLQGKEQELQIRYQTSTILLANNIEQILAQKNSHKDLSNILNSQFKQLKKQYALTAFKLQNDSWTLMLGKIHPEDALYQQTFLAYQNNQNKSGSSQICVPKTGKERE